MRLRNILTNRSDHVTSKRIIIYYGGDNHTAKKCTDIDRQVEIDVEFLYGALLQHRVYINNKRKKIGIYHDAASRISGDALTELLGSHNVDTCIDPTRPGRVKEQD